MIGEELFVVLICQGCATNYTVVTLLKSEAMNGSHEVLYLFK